MISRTWTEQWERITPFFSFPADIRRVIYTTNAIESLNRSLRQIFKTRGAVPSDEAGYKLMYRALQKIMRKWTRPIPNWQLALNQFAIRFEGRLPRP